MIVNDEDMELVYMSPNRNKHKKNNE